MDGFNPARRDDIRKLGRHTLRVILAMSAAEILSEFEEGVAFFSNEVRESIAVLQERQMDRDHLAGMIQAFMLQDVIQMYQVSADDFDDALVDDAIRQCRDEAQPATTFIPQTDRRTSPWLGAVNESCRCEPCLN